MIRVRIRDYGMKSGAWEPETDPLFSGPPALDTKHFCLKWRGKCLVNKFQSEIIHDPFLDPLCWRGVVRMFCCRWSGVWPANTENHWSRATCLWLSFELYKRKWSPLNRVFLHAYFFFTSDGFSSHFFSKSFDDIQSSSIKNSIILFKTSLVRRQLQFLGLLCVWQKTERSSQWFCLSVKLLTLLHFLHTLLPFPAVNKHPNSTSGSRRCTRPARLQCLPEGLFFSFPVFCHVRRHPTLLLLLTVIGTSVPNQVFTFWQTKKTVLQQTCFMPCAASAVSSALAAGPARPDRSHSTWTAHKVPNAACFTRWSVFTLHPKLLISTQWQ